MSTARAHMDCYTNPNECWLGLDECPMKPQECNQDHDCVPAGHPVYDGFRITELWAIVKVDPEDDQEGILYSQDGPLLAADTRRLEYLESVLIHAQVAGHEVALKHFKLVED